MSVIVALLFGSLPAWHTSSIGDLAARIREDSGNATGDRHRQRLRSTLIVAETALAVVLLVGAGLLLRSFLRMSSVELGFDVSRVQTFNVSLPDMKYQTPAQRAEFVNRVGIARVSAARRRGGWRNFRSAVDQLQICHLDVDARRASAQRR